VQLVSEKRRACDLLAADGAHPTGNARSLYRYEYRQWRRAVLLSYCARASEGELCARRKGVQKWQWQARGCAKTVRTRRVRMSDRELGSDEKVSERSASVYV
jgi:hypothetical protein